MRDTDWWLKKVWLVNGGLLLALLVLGAGGVLLSFLMSIGGRGAVPVRSAASDTAEERPRAVRYSEPRAVRGTDTRLVDVYHGSGYQAGAGLSGGYSERAGPGPLVNVIFLDASGAGRLLVDRPAYIVDVSYPSPASDTLVVAADRRTWISYQMALDDTNGDRRLDDRDRRTLYVSALDGTGLRRVLPDGFRVRSVEPLSPDRMLVLALQEPANGDRADEDDLPQRAFVYDVAAARLQPYAALDSLSAAAGRILRR